MLLNSPVLWFGGKGKLKHQLLPLVPQHNLYVEVFGGGASLLFAKPMSTSEVYNDVDKDLINFFTVLRDKSSFNRLHRLALATPFSRELYNEYRHSYKTEPDNIKRAHQWFAVSRQSFGSIEGRSWGGVSKATKNCALAWYNVLQDLPLHHARFSEVWIDNMDWRQVLETYDSGSTFFYLDPPYVSSTRRRGGYRHEMTNLAHQQLIETVQSLNGKVMLSGYSNPIYDRLPWSRIDFDTVCYHVGKTNDIGTKGSGSLKDSQSRVESVWTNYMTQLTLF